MTRHSTPGAPGELLLITPWAGGNPPLNGLKATREEEACGPLAVPPGSGPEPRGHLHDEFAASFAALSKTASNSLNASCQKELSALEAGKRCSATLASASPGAK